jgi:hypothetical protein
LTDFSPPFAESMGLEWLATIDEDDVEPGDGFRREGDDEGAKLLTGQLYLLMSNQRAAEELLSMWNRWTRDETYDFGWGSRTVSKVFNQLRDVRTWGTVDRLSSTGILDEWSQVTAMATSPLPFEVELWYRNDSTSRLGASARVKSLVEGESGTIYTEAEIPDIRYHALVGELPPARLSAIVASEDSQLVTCDDVMFVRPIGQADIGLERGEADTIDIERREFDATELGPPLIGLLDGLPLENHESLQGCLSVDDPEDFASDYLVAERRHGTWMASLIVAGDLEDESARPLARTVYVRPVLQPDPRAPSAVRPERAPILQTFPDVVRLAIERMFVGDEEDGGAAPTVEIINFSIGDPSRPFDNGMSPLARVLDWLSYRFGIIFVVSAGNRGGELQFACTRDEFEKLDTERIEAATLTAVAESIHLRRILSPAESINAVAVGRIHSDSSSLPALAESTIDPLSHTPRLPATSSAAGTGWRRSIRPDISFAGGRQLLDAIPGPKTDQALFSPRTIIGAPGHLVASPGAGAAALRSYTHVGGTSNSAALVSRELSFIRDDIDSRLQELGLALPQRPVRAALMKAFAAHGASWGAAGHRITSVLDPFVTDVKAMTTRFLGYGEADLAWARKSADHRATVFGWGELLDGEANSFPLPLPQALSGQAVLRRLTITLAWLTSTWPGNKLYRGASLWFSPPVDELLVKRVGPDWQAVQRGTIQHEVLEGTRAVSFAANAELSLQVNCRSDAGPINEPVPFGLIATLEVDETIGLPIYDEISARIGALIRVQV